MTNIQRSISGNEETTLHIAAAANQEDFVKKLSTLMTSNNYNLTAENNVGNTALTYATAAGNVKIAKYRSIYWFCPILQSIRIKTF